MDSIVVATIICRALPGHTVQAARREAAILALTERRPVVVQHNCTKYFYSPHDLIKSCETQDVAD